MSMRPHQKEKQLFQNPGFSDQKDNNNHKKRVYPDTPTYTRDVIKVSPTVYNRFQETTSPTTEKSPHTILVQ